MIRYVGPAAKGARAAATVMPADVRDLAERALYGISENSAKEHQLLGPAVVVFFSCCGGTPLELEKVKRGDLVLTKKSGHLRLPGHSWLEPRTIPLFDFSRSRLRAYVDNTKYDGEDDPLFKSRAGTLLSMELMYGRFDLLGRRIGLDGGQLPRILRSAFVRWMDECSDDRIRLYLIGKKVQGPRVADPKISEVQAQLFEAHPMANLDRDELNQPGAVRRAFPDPHFPTLSREARADLESGKGIGGIVAPDEARRAIKSAVASGMSKDATADHFRLSVKTVRKLLKDGPTPAGPKPAHPSYQRALREFVKNDPSLTPRKLTKLVNEKYGSSRRVKRVRNDAWKLGIKLARDASFMQGIAIAKKLFTCEDPFPCEHLAPKEVITCEDLAPKEAFIGKWDVLRPKLLEMMSGDQRLSLTEIRCRLAELGIEATEAVLNQSLRKIGLSHLVRRKIKGVDAAAERFAAAWPAVRAAILKDPGLTDIGIGRIIEAITGRAIERMPLKKLLEGRGDLPPRSNITKATAARQAFAKAWPEVRRRMAEDDSLSNPSILKIIQQTTGWRMGNDTLKSMLAKRNDVPPRLSASGRRAAACSATARRRALARTGARTSAPNS